MIIGYGTDGIIKVQVILEWDVITSPSNNIIRGICAFSFEYFAYILIDNNPILFFIFVPGMRE